jgi:hypothetical protein
MNHITLVTGNNTRLRKPATSVSHFFRLLLYTYLR